MHKDAKGFDEQGRKYTIGRTRDGIHVSIISDREGFIRQITCLAKQEEIADECKRQQVDPKQVYGLSYSLAELGSLHSMKHLFIRADSYSHNGHNGSKRSRW